MNWKKACVAILVLYTFVHFLYAGVYQPIFVANDAGAIRQVDEEAELLLRSIESKTPITELQNSRQYGPVFLFVFYAGFLLFKSHYQWFLLALSYITLAIAFYFCWKALFKPTKPELGMLILWLNFAPVYYLLQNKNVETWELFLISLALFSVVNMRSLLAGISIALGSLTKFFPAVYALYFLFKDRKALAWAFSAGIVLLVLSGIAFGPALGLSYPLKIFLKQSGKESWASTHFENNSFKGIIHKAFSSFDAGGGYVFVLRHQNAAFILSLAIQLLLIVLVIYIFARKWHHPEENFLKFGMLGPASMLIAPLAAHEYGILLLPSFTILLYLYLKKMLSKTLVVIAAISYFLIGQFLPSSVIMTLLPLRWLNEMLGNAHFTLLESYRAYGFPFLGFLLLFIVFAALLLRSRLTERNKNGSEL